jgi:hypothetical protein
MKSSAEQQPLSNVVCQQCREAHRKCDRKLPTCSLCIKKGRQCCYDPQESTSHRFNSNTSKKRKHIDIETPTNTISSSTTTTTMNTSSNALPLKMLRTESNGVQYIGPADSLNTCFRMFSATSMGIENQTGAIAQMLHLRTIPRNIVLNSEQIQMKADQALWFIQQALALLFFPSAETSYPNAKEEKRIYAIIRSKFKNVNVPKQEELISTFGKYSRYQLLSDAEKLFTAAKEIILDPLVFSNLSNNHTLAQAINSIGMYVSVVGDRSEDLQRLLQIQKVYIDKYSPILKIVTSNPEIEKQQSTVSTNRMNYVGMKVQFFVNYEPRSQRFYRLKTLKKFVKRIFTWLKINELIVLSNERHEALRKIQSITKDKLLDTDSLLTQVFDACSNALNITVPQEGMVEFYWKSAIFAMHTIATEIGVAFAMGNPARTKMYQNYERQAAKSVTEACNHFLPIVVCRGSRFFGLFAFIARVHVQYSVDLCTSIPCNDQEIRECETLLNTDVHILEAVNSKYFSSSLSELIMKLRKQLLVHQQFKNQIAQTSNVEIWDEELTDFASVDELLQSTDFSFLDLFNM